MADSGHVAILNEGVEVWNAWRRKNADVRPDLRYADLVGADLSDADLIGADLSGANLSGANLVGANLSGADLIDADLVGASLVGASLIGASLIGADVRYAVLNGTILSGANLALCQIGSTSIGAIDLSQAEGIETVQHEGPSTIGTDTLARTLRGAGGRFTDEQIVFFEGAGVPPLLLEYLPSIMEAEPIQFYSCFISYNTADEAFATRLNDDMNKAGVHTWKWDLDAVAGRDLRANIDGAIRHYDKIILVCSADSLTSGPVEREIERALQKEDRLKAAHADRAKEAVLKGEPPPFKDTDVLVPIRIDDTVFNWQSQFAADVTRRYIPDFSGKTERRTPSYKAEVERLIAALKPDSWPRKSITLAK